MKVTKMSAKPKTIGKANVNAAAVLIRKVLLEWQTQHFIRIASCEVVPSTSFIVHAPISETLNIHAPPLHQ